MGLFDNLFKNRPKEKGDFRGTFKMLNGYTPVFTSRSGGVYESELIRAAINAKATHISKLKIDIIGSARPALHAKLKHAPNAFQSWSQFMYRLDTILEINNTAFITPVYDEYGEPSGVYCPVPERCEIVQYNNVPYLRYEFSRGQKAAIELAYCGIMNKFQYKNDFFGETNAPLTPTMDLIHIQDQGIKEGVKSAATYRFMARMGNFSNDETLQNERKRFTEKNFGYENNAGGLLLFPNTFQDIKQIDVKPWIVDADQVKLIKDNVFDYFGVNEDVLQNKAYGDKWSAFYEGAIEPFAIQFSEVMTKMLFTLREQSNNNAVVASANRLQYLSNAEKLNVTRDLLDRGIITQNQAMEIWNLPPVEGGDVRIIRGEYYNADDKVGEEGATDEE